MFESLEIAEARPSAFSYVPAHTALLIIDMQRDFLEPGGFGAALGNDVSLLAGTVAPIRRLLAGFRSSGLPVFHTLEGHQPDLSDCPPAKLAHGQPGLRIGDLGPMGRILVRGEPGHAPIPACRPWPGEVVVHKPGKGAFYQTDLEADLRRRTITTLVVAGVTAEVCVQTTLREAVDRGFRVLLVADGTASYIPLFHKVVLEMVTSQGGIVGWTATCDQILFSLLRAEIWRGKLQWHPLRPGLFKAVLTKDDDGWEAALLDYQPGAKAPRHRHAGLEHILILEGGQSDERGHYGPMATVENLPGTDHEVDSADGCLLFITWEKPVEFFEVD